MFSNYSQALCFMQSTAHLGSVPGLARLQALLSEHKIMTILVKGSRSAAMEEVVHALQENGTC